MSNLRGVCVCMCIYTPCPSALDRSNSSSDVGLYPSECGLYVHSAVMIPGH